MPIKALLFDLDGTLIDSAPDIHNAINKVLKDNHQQEIDIHQTRQFIGNGALKLVERAFRASNMALSSDDFKGLTTDFLHHYADHECIETCPYETVFETLSTCRQAGFQMALCTNKPTAPTHVILKGMGLAPFFDCVVAGDDVAQKKPHPEILEKALHHCDALAAESIMIGDSINDIDAAKRLNIRSIAVSYGYRKGPVEDLGADHVVDRFKDILPLIGL